MTDTFQSDALAEETHRSPIWILPILLALIGPAISLSQARTRTTVVVWGATFVGFIALGLGAMVLSGFQYRFLQHGVEVEMLGFRLRSIPRQSIVSYSIEPWSLIRGYGIRGVGSTRAYVWCNQVVHIKTSNGDFFLGHNDPQQIVHDLDMVMSSLPHG
ncbi:MAG: hypothetical protein ACLPHI_22570 [Terriglobales bacterium]|jgi:hypothetical protein